MSLVSVKKALSKTQKQAVLSLFTEFTWTENAYLAMTEMNRHLELSEGRLIVHDMPTLKHQDIVHALVRKLDAWLAQHKTGRVYFAPVPIRLWPGKFREPDVFLYLETPQLSPDAAYAPIPDMVVEALSPGTRRVDMGEKFDEYALAGIREYWQIDPESRSVHVYTLTDGRYVALGIFSNDQSINSVVLPGFEARASELFD